MNKAFLRIVGKGIAAVGLTGWLATPPIVKRAAHNIMSHHPDQSNMDLLLSSPKLAWERGTYTGLTKKPCGIPENSDLNAIYLGLQKNPFKVTDKKPTAQSNIAGVTFYDPGCAIRFTSGPYMLRTLGSEKTKQILEMKNGDAIKLPVLPLWGGGHIFNDSRQLDEIGLELDILAGSYTLSVGRDEKGRYLSFYDIWDFAPGKGGSYSNQFSGSLASKVLPYIGTPIHFYKRFYFEENGITEEILKKEAERKS